MNRVGIVDVGIGNVGSLKSAVYELSFDYQLVRQPGDLADCDTLILPGVGAFAHGMGALSAAGLIDPVRGHVAAGKPMLGICLGMQMLFEHGEEGGGAAGLGLIPGRVRRLRDVPDMPLPHVGWNALHRAAAHPVLDDIRADVDFYFVHSFCAECDSDFVLGTSDYSEVFPAVVGRGSVLGMQFHPEKSQRNGLRMLENFCHWDGRC